MLSCGLCTGGIARRLPRLAFVLLLALAYRQLQAPPPKIPGTPGGPPVTSPRVRLQDGRHLAYYESGVPREEARHKIIFMHGFDSCRYDVLRVSPVCDRLALMISAMECCCCCAT
jgi:hypothetical protein